MRVVDAFHIAIGADFHMDESSLFGIQPPVLMIDQNDDQLIVTGG